MTLAAKNLRIYAAPRSALTDEIRAFLTDRQAHGLRPGTIAFYADKLDLLVRYLAARGVTAVEAITARDLRAFLLHLGEGHTPGGVHAVYRAVKAFLRWWEVEAEPEGWRNPLARVQSLRLPTDPLPPVDLDDLRRVLATCRRRTFAGDRDYALLLFLLDTGVRRAEMCALNVGDVDLATGAVLVRRGKGGKRRMTYIGARTRRRLLAYLRRRGAVAPEDPLWVTTEGTRLGLAGLREVVRRWPAARGWSSLA